MNLEVICEGIVDNVVLAVLLENRGIEIHPKRRDDKTGRIEAMRTAAVRAKTIGDTQIVLVLDRNGLGEEEIRSEVARVFKREWKTDEDELAQFWYRHNEHCIHIVLAGRPGSELLRQLNVDRFAIDDYLLELCMDDSALKSFIAGEDKLSRRPVTAGELRSIVDDVTKVLMARGVDLKTAKRYLHVISAILGAPINPPEMAKRLVRRCPEDTRIRVFGGLLSDILAETPSAA